MSLPITTAGVVALGTNSVETRPQGTGVNQEVPREKKTGRHQAAQRQAAAKDALLEGFIASLPGNKEGGEGSSHPPFPVLDLKEPVLPFSKKLEFMVDYESHEVLVKVIDANTDRVINILPPVEIRMLNRRLKESHGFFINKRV